MCRNLNSGQYLIVPEKKKHNYAWSFEFDFSTLFSCCSSPNGGVTILLNNNFAFQLERLYSDPKGRFIICGAKTNGTLFTFHLILDGGLELRSLSGVNPTIRPYVVFASKAFSTNPAKSKKVGSIPAKFNEPALSAHLDCR